MAWASGNPLFQQERDSSPPPASRDVRELHPIVAHPVLLGDVLQQEACHDIRRVSPPEALGRDPEDIRTSEAKLREVVDTLPPLVRIWTNLADGRAAVHPDDLPKLMETSLEMVAAGKAGDFETRLRRHDGVSRWFLMS
jgi:hypothetical protein